MLKEIFAFFEFQIFSFFSVKEKKTKQNKTPLCLPFVYAFRVPSSFLVGMKRPLPVEVKHLAKALPRGASFGCGVNVGGSAWGHLHKGLAQGHGCKNRVPASLFPPK